MGYRWQSTRELRELSLVKARHQLLKMAESQAWPRFQLVLPLRWIAMAIMSLGFIEA
jgi:hypothetical protein